MNIVYCSAEHIAATDGPQTSQDDVKTLTAYPSYAIEDEGVTVACGGIFQVWPGRGRLWLKTSSAAADHSHAVVKWARQFLIFAVKEYPRVEALAFSESDCRLLEILGMNYNATMREALPGLTAKLYSIEE